MINTIYYFLISMLVSLTAAAYFVNRLNLSKWWGVVFLVILGIALYLTNIFLIRYYIKKRASGVVELDELYGKPMKDGEYLWEKTAGTGIVPKWVSFIGICAMASFAGILVWIVKGLFIK